MRKTMLTIVIIILFLPASLAQTNVTIGSGDCSVSTNWLPWCHAWGEYSEAQYGIPASALASISGTDPVIIDKIGWIRCRGGAPTENYLLSVYIDQAPGTYDLGSLCTTPYANTNLVAYNKTLMETGTDVFMLTLDTPFVYIPGNALIISVCDTLSGYSEDPPFWSANIFLGNGFLRYRNFAAFDCNMLTDEERPYSRYCNDKWITTVFSCSYTGNKHEIEMLPPDGTGGATGTVEPAPDIYLLPEGASQLITAYPVSGSDFDYWELDGAWYSNNSRETVLINNDHTVQAFFKPFTAMNFPFYEDFSGIAAGQLPANWELDPVTEIWGVVNTHRAEGVPPELLLDWISYYHGSQYRLITPKIDGTTVTEILLMFKHYVSNDPPHQGYHAPYTLRIQTSIDNGSTWVDRYSVTQSGNIWPETLMIELNEVAGEEFNVCFLFNSDAYSGRTFWYIDDVVMIADYIGQLNGTVTNDQGPVEGAVVNVVETGTSAVTGPTGKYELFDMAGKYSIQCKALGHNVAIESGVEIIENTIATQDFYLTYPLADIYPPNFYVKQYLGESTDEYLYLDNTGIGPLDYQISIKYLGSQNIGNWTNLAPVATAVQWPSSCFGEGKFFVIGGISSTDPSRLFKSIQIYDTETGTWSVSAEMFTPVFASVAAYYNGKVYVVGGYRDNNFNVTGIVQIYNIASDTWSAGAYMPTARGGAAGGLIDGKIYSLGGATSSSFPTENVAYVYDIASNSWARLTSGPLTDKKGMTLGGGCAYKGKLYVGGHFSSSYYQFFEFDPADAGIWTIKANIPRDLGGQTVSMVGLETEGVILAVGGGYDWSATGTTWSYDPDTNIWKNLNKPMKRAVLGGACAAEHGKIYFYGGTIGFGPEKPAPFMMNTFSCWLTADNTPGSIEPDETETVTVTFDAGKVLSPGNYFAKLTVSHNSGDEIPLNIPVTMEIDNGGILEGFVYDDGRRTIENATIKIIETGQTAQSDNTGFYHFPAVPPGVYTITCAAKFNSVTETDVEIIADDTTTLDFRLTTPVLSIDPPEFFHTQDEKTVETIQDALTVENTGSGTLDWSSRVEYHDQNLHNNNVLIASKVMDGGIYYDPTQAYAYALEIAGYVVASTTLPPLFGDIPFPTPFTANEYAVVVVLTSENNLPSSTYNLTPNDEAALRAYQDTGGNVLLVGQAVLWGAHPTWGTASGWFRTHLGLMSVEQNVLWDATRVDLTGMPGTFTENLNFTILGKDVGGPFFEFNFFIDDLTPDTDAYVIWLATNQTTAKAAIAFDNGVTRAVFSTAAFCAAQNMDDFYDAIAAIMEFLNPSSISWLRMTPMSGSLLSGQTQSIGLTFDSTSLEPGEYHATIIYKNAATSAKAPVEVTLIVEEISPTETPIPTNTPAPPTATSTPKPTDTPIPTPRCDYLGSRLVISQEDPFRAGDMFWLKCNVCNNTDTPMQQIATAVLLGVYGEFWFWPGWTQDFDLEHHDYLPGLTEIQVFEPFTWPDVKGTALGLEFYSGLINAEMNDLIGEYGYLTFGYTDR